MSFLNVVRDQMVTVQRTAGYSQVDVAELAGMSVHSLNAYLNKRQSLGLDRFESLCAILGLQLAPRSRSRELPSAQTIGHISRTAAVPFSRPVCSWKL